MGLGDKDRPGVVMKAEVGEGFARYAFYYGVGFRRGDWLGVGALGFGLLVCPAAAGVVLGMWRSVWFWGVLAGVYPLACWGLSRELERRRGKADWPAVVIRANRKGLRIFSRVEGKRRYRFLAGEIREFSLLQNGNRCVLIVDGGGWRKSMNVEFQVDGKVDCAGVEREVGRAMGKGRQES